MQTVENKIYQFLHSSFKHNLAQLNNIAYNLYSQGRFEEAAFALKEALYYAEVCFDYNCYPWYLKKEFRFDIICGMAGDIYGNIGDCVNAQKYYEMFHFLKMQLKSDFNHDMYIPMYQFRRLTDYTLANLINREFTLSTPKVMNDIVDTLLFTRFDTVAYGENCVHRGHLPSFKDSHDDYRIASFCMDNLEKNRRAICNPLMWAHYADEHRGFCVKYQIHHDDIRCDDASKRTASRFFKIRYVDPYKHRLNFNVESIITSETAFLKKSSDWEYENEVRLLQYKPFSGAIRTQYKLSEQSYIQAVYFGARCSKATIDCVRESLKNLNVAFFQMKINNSNVFQLIEEPI